MPRKKSDDPVDNIIGKRDEYYLNPKQRRFVDEYLIDLNPTRAYKSCGYSSRKNPAQAAWILLRNKAVQRAVRKAMEERQQRCHVDQDRIIKELAKIGFANIRSVVSWNAFGVTPKPSSDIMEEDAAAISEVSVTFNEYGANVKVKMYDKRQALVDLGNHLGIFEKREGPKDPVEEAQKICQLVREMTATMTGEDNAGQNNKT